MSEYTQGVYQDGAAILRDGKPLTIEEILHGLRQADKLAAALESVLHDYACAIDSMEFEEEAGESRELYVDTIQTLTNYSKSKGE